MAIQERRGLRVIFRGARRIACWVLVVRMCRIKGGSPSAKWCSARRPTRDGDFDYALSRNAGPLTPIVVIKMIGQSSWVGSRLEIWPLLECLRQGSGRSDRISGICVVIV